MIDFEQLLPALPAPLMPIAALDRLIQAKRDAGRPKDLEAIAELEALREE